MFFNVSHDHFIGHVARTGRKVPSCPHMPPPKSSTQTLVLLQQLPTRLPLQCLHQIARREMGRNRHKNMHMISRNMSFHDLNVLGFTNLSDQFPYSLSNIRAQHLLAVFRHPYQMIFQIINGMARLAIVLHTASILKSSPEGEGFSPIPRRGQ